MVERAIGKVELSIRALQPTLKAASAAWDVLLLRDEENSGKSIESGQIEVL